MCIRDRYGTEANNGVIQITTKRGKAGRAVTTLNTRLGNNWFQGAEGRIGRTYRRLADGSISAWNPVAVERAEGRDLFNNGLSQSYNMGINGGARSASPPGPCAPTMSSAKAACSGCSATPSKPPERPRQTAPSMSPPPPRNCTPLARPRS